MQKKILQSIKTSIIIIILLIYLLSIIPVNADDGPDAASITINSISAYSGDQGLTVTVNGTWNETIGGYSLLIEFRPGLEKINVTDVNINGCINEDAFFMLPIGISREPSVIGFVALVGFNNSIPPGSGNLLNILVDINEDVVPDTISIHLRESDTWCYYLIGGGGRIYPDLNEGELEIINRPPDNFDETPQGVTEGETEVEYTYSITERNDPDGDDVYYLFDWGDGTDSGWLEIPTAKHIWNLAGIYNIRVKARDIYDAESDWSESLQVTITNLSEIIYLQISTSDEVTENNDFTAKITRSDTGLPVENVEVTFDDTTSFTDENGQVSFTAKSVDDDTVVTISASATGFEPTSKQITILNQVETKIGWLYGGVYESSGVSIPEAKIKILSTDTSVTTDETGRYNVPLTVGFYSIEVSKSGFQTYTEENVEVIKNSAIEYNFYLEKLEKPEGEESGVVDYVIQTFIDEGDVGLEIDATSTDPQITSYADIEVNVTESNPLSEGRISFTFSGEEESGKLLVIYTAGVDDPDKVVVKYDDVIIERSKDIILFFSAQNNKDSWAIFPTEQPGKYVILFKISHFSEHTITISSVIDALGGITAVTFYAVLSVVAVIVFAGTIYIRKKM